MKVVKNKDEEFVKEFTERLKENDGYCPCRLDKNADTKCMCAEFREQIKNGELGNCHCGLYEIVE